MVVKWKPRGLGWVLPILLAMMLSLILPISTAQAQDYSFTVDRNMVNISIKENSSIDIEYWITFTVDSGARPIDVVDVGMPNNHYDFSSVRADIDGVPVTDIKRSPVLASGIRAYLGSHIIPSGSTGTFHLTANNPHMVYPDTEDETYASVEFSPTWYASRYTHGTTYLQVSIYFPPGVGPDETRYHQTEFTEARMDGETPVMTWVNPSARPDKQYMYGVSFPRKYVSEVFPVPSGPTPSRATCGFQGWWALLIVGGIIGGGVAATKARNRRRKMRYLPPKIMVEGVQVRKGLTAVEAAVVTETPVNKMLSMILFSLVRKGLVSVEFTKPLKLKILREDWLRDQPIDIYEYIYTPDKPSEEGRMEPEKGSGNKLEIRDYEAGFLSAIDQFGTLSEYKLKEMLVRLIRSVQRKMKGFAARATAAYYYEIVDKAWRQVREAETPEVVDENLEWVMLDNAFEKKMPKAMEGRPVFVPLWYGAYGHHVAATSGAGAGTPVPFTLPGSQFAHRIVTGFESIGKNIVGSIPSFSSGVAQVTNPPPPPPPPSSGSGGWGGGGCACACACAGCACACAGGGA